MPATAARPPSAELNSLRQVAVGTFGDVYIADSFNNAIRKLTPSGTTVGQTTNAFGNIKILAANTWFIIKGENLAPAGDSRIWHSSDFVNNQLPTSAGRRQRDAERRERIRLLHQPAADQCSGAAHASRPVWRRFK